MTIALDQNSLFVITVNPQKDKKYWSKANDTIINSFAFEKPDNPANGDSSSPADDGVVYEGEETVE